MNMLWQQSVVLFEHSKFKVVDISRSDSNEYLNLSYGNYPTVAPLKSATVFYIQRLMLV